MPYYLFEIHIGKLKDGSEFIQQVENKMKIQTPILITIFFLVL